MEANSIIREFFNSIKELITAPERFWNSQKEVQVKGIRLYARYYFLLTVLIAIAVFAGTWISSPNFYIGFAILKSLRVLILFNLFYWLCIYSINLIIPAYGGRKNLEAVHKMVAYSLIPYLLVAIITGVLPSLYIIDLIGLYGAWVFWKGVKVMQVVPERKQITFTIVSVVICLFLLIVMGVILWKIFVAYY